MTKKLTDKEEAFCQAYVNDAETRWNKTQSAIKAGYSKKSAKELGYDTYTKAHVKGRIAELEREQRESNDELINKIVGKYKEIAGLDDDDEDKKEGHLGPEADIKDVLQALKGLSSYAGMDKLDLTSKGEALPSTIIFKGVKADNE
ncbi:MAG: terminase small subunit [Gammaproteobacteria bacterium]|nr:terminase small subunit [Gammaproteobacteria bacterium]